MLPGDVAHDGVGLGQLRLAVHVVGQVGEVEAVGELVVEPAGLVEVGSWREEEDMQNCHIALFLMGMPHIKEFLTNCPFSPLFCPFWHQIPVW